MSSVAHVLRVEDILGSGHPEAIDRALEQLPGVVASIASTQGPCVLVVADHTPTNTTEILATLARLGYRATFV